MKITLSHFVILYLDLDWSKPKNKIIHDKWNVWQPYKNIFKWCNTWVDNKRLKIVTHYVFRWISHLCFINIADIHMHAPHIYCGINYTSSDHWQDISACCVLASAAVACCLVTYGVLFFLSLYITVQLCLRNPSCFMGLL